MSSEDDESSYASDVSVDGRHIGGIVDSPLHFDGLSTATGTSTLSAPRNTDHPESIQGASSFLDDSPFRTFTSIGHFQANYMIA